MLDLRVQLNDTLGKLTPPVKLSLNDFVLKAAAEAVRRVPAVNAAFAGDSIQQFADVQLSFAVAIAEGLITPIVKQAQNKSLIEISKEAKSLAAKAKEGKLKPEEFQGGDLHRLEPGHARHRPVQRDHQSAAGCDPRRGQHR